jgi:hypothetical protein
MTSNRFLVCLPSGETVEWGRDFSPVELTPDSRYFGRVLASVDAALPDAGLTFVLTWSVTSLPSYGRDVVVLLIGDEWCRWPYYAHRVGAVFKTHGTAPSHRPPRWDPRDPVMVSLFVQWMRVLALGVPSRMRQLRWRVAPRSRRSIVEPFPVGCYQAVETEERPWRDRPIDISFAGSVEHDEASGGFRRLLRSPKVHARRAMLQALEQLARERPDLVVTTRTTASFSAAAAADPDEYSRLLADSKLVLAPRGTNVETFRFFEAHKYGALAVTEPLPPHWFYADEALLTVQSWRDLSRVVEEVFPRNGDRSRGERLHAEARDRWARLYSEEAVARRLIRRLRETGLVGPTRPSPIR